MSDPPRDFYLYKNVYPPADLVNFAKLTNNDVITLFIESNSGAFPTVHPKHLKADIEKLISNHVAIDSIKTTKQGKLALLIHYVDTAIQMLQLTSLANIAVSPRVQFESIASRFLLYGIPVDVSCEEIADELHFNGVHVLEIRRFMGKNQGNSFPTTKVLVRMLGTQLPSEVKIYYQIHKISLFIDRPRPCLNCWNFNHSTKFCRAQKSCRNYSESHEGTCQAENLKCSNCSEEHSAEDKSCPIYKKEICIQKFKCEHNLSISEARRQFRITE